MMAGAFRNVAVSELTGSPWLAGFNRCEPNFFGAVWEAVFGCFFTGANHLPTGIPLGNAGDIISSGLILPLNICVGLVVACTMYALYTLFRKGGF